MGSTATVAVLFCDCVSSTERATRLGEPAADDFRRSFFAALRGCVADSDGMVVKNTGDGLMVVFEHSTVDALQCAVLMHDRVASVDPEDPVRLRIGVSVGEVISEDGDWFGSTVVTAARLCSAAGPGQSFVPAIVGSLVGSRAVDLRFAPVGNLVLKGLPHPIEVVAVERADGPDVVPAPRVPRQRPRPSPKLRWVAVGAVALVAVLIASLIAVTRSGEERAGSAASTASARGDEVSRPLGYRPRFVAAECDAETLAADPGSSCGTLHVPQSRADPGGPTIELYVRRRRAATARAGAAPVIVLDLGEPFATSSLPAGAPTYFLWLRGYTSHRCDELAAVWLDTLVQRDDAPDAIAARGQATGACRSRLWNEGVRMDGFTLLEAADDVRDLALALHLPRVTVAAGGLTSPAAVRFARSNPGLVEALLLTNPTPPGQSTWADPAGTLSRQFDHLADLCRVDRACDARFGDLRSMYRARFLDLTVRPQLVTTLSLTGAGPYAVLVDGRRLAEALRVTMQDSTRLGLIPAAIVDADAGLVGAAAINDDVNDLFGPDAYAAAYLAWRCPYDWPLNRTAAISDAQHPEFAGADAPGMSAACAAWSARSLVDELSGPLELDVPVLLVEGGFSVAGANRWAESMAESLPRATVLRMETLGENVLFTNTPCLRSLRRRFVADPSADLDVASCERRSPPIEFRAGS